MKLLKKIIKDNRLLLLADTFINSVFTLFLTILLTRIFGINDFGIYVIFYSLILFAQSIFQGIVLQPMSVILPPMVLNDFNKNLAAINFLQLKVSFYISIIILIFVYLFFIIFQKHIDAEFLFIFSLSIITFLNYQYYRAIFLARLKYLNLVALDFFYVCSYLVFLFLNIEGLNLTSIFEVIFFASLSSSILSFFAQNIFRLHNSFSLKPNAISKEILAEGKWLLSVNIIAWLRTNTANYFALYFIGPVATGILRIAQTIYGPLSVAYVMIASYVPQNGSKILSTFGKIKFKKFIYKIALAVFLISISYNMLAYFFIDYILEIFKDTELLQTNKTAILIIGLQFILIGYIELLNSSLRVFKKGKIIARIYLIEIMITSVMGIYLLYTFEFMGLAVWRVLSATILLFLMYKHFYQELKKL